MINRSRKIVVRASLATLTLALFACGHAMAVATEPSSASRTPAGASSGAPAGESSGATSAPNASDNQSAVQDGEMLANLLTTGTSSDDSESFWECGSDIEGQGFFARYWSGGNGYLRESEFRWKTSSATTVSLSMAGDATVLSDILFIDEAVPFDRFLAVRDGGERLDCRWGGPSRYSDLGIQFDDVGGLPAVLAGSTGSRDWSCSVSQADGSVTTPVFTYSVEGTGVGEKGSFTWYFDDDLLFMAAEGGQGFEVLHDFSIVNDDARIGPLEFVAQNADAPISCSSAL